MTVNLKAYISGRIFLSLILVLVSGIALAVSPQEAVSRFANTPRLPSGRMAVLVTDLPSGKVVGSYNADTPLTPASIMKAVTLASLSDVADVDVPLTTPVYIDGEVREDGVVMGNIIVEGKGDPSINSGVWPLSDDFAVEIAEALRREGIREVKGTVIVDESYFAGGSIPPTWASADLPHAYGTGSHTFNYSNNAVGKSALKDPAAAFRTDLRRKMSGVGISLGETPLPASGERQLLLTHASPELKEILRSCMMRSDNLYAETSLRLFGKERGGDGSTEDAARRERDYWRKKGIDFSGVEIIDGSGLSRSNRLTARFLENILRNKMEDVEYVSFFPLAGQEGTLKKFLAGTPLDSYIAMKTGSMKGIQCYAGYKLDDDFAPTHAVVIMVNDFTCDRGYLRSQVERMLLDIFSEENMTNRTLTTPRKGMNDYAE